MDLTGKQELFAQGIAKGLTQADAYREAYDCSNMSNDAIYVEACKSINDPKIALRIGELKEAIQKELVYTAKQGFDKFKELQDRAIVEGNINAAIKAEENKCELAGLYVKKVENTFKTYPKVVVEVVDGSSKD